MNQPVNRITNSEFKNSELHISLSNGQAYKICSEGQIEVIKMQAREQIAYQAKVDGKPLDGDQLEVALAKYMDNCGFATLDYVLAKMDPETRELWKASYRFSGIKRKL